MLKLLLKHRQSNFNLCLKNYSHLNNYLISQTFIILFIVLRNDTTLKYSSNKIITTKKS